MKRITVGSLAALTLLSATSVFAAPTASQKLSSTLNNVMSHPSRVSIGYAHGNVDSHKPSGTISAHGVNLKYLQEVDNQLGFVTSFNYVSGDESYLLNKTKAKSYSFTAGPSYKFNERFTAYTAIGFAHTKSKWLSRSWSDTNLALGFGGQFTFCDHFLADVSAEYSADAPIFTLSLGYMF